MYTTGRDNFGKRVINYDDLNFIAGRAFEKKNISFLRYLESTFKAFWNFYVYSYVLRRNLFEKYV